MKALVLLADLYIEERFNLITMVEV